MKKGFGITCVLVASCFMLGGCASIPDLSAEDEELVSEYAASLLLKYDKENHSRLVDVSGIKTAYETAQNLYEQAEQKYYADLEAEEEQRRKETAEWEAGNSENLESSSTHNTGSDGTGGAVVYDARSVADIIGATSFSIEYGGFDLMNSYPEDASDYYFALSATKGNDLLVVYFNVANRSQEKQTLNIFEVSPTFKLSVNDNGYYSVLKTFVLEDDMSLYLGDFDAGETKRLVLLTEVPQGTVVNSLSMRVSVANDSITKSLK